MVITWHSLDFFKVQFGDLTIAVNPISKDSKLKSTRFGADIALIGKHDVDHNGLDQVSFGEKKPFAIEGPGEYEIKGVFIKGFPAGKDASGKLNTMYTVSLENMNLCFLGALSTIELEADTKAALPDIDILFVPIGGEQALTASEAYKLSVILEPKLIIPAHYKDDAAGEAALKAFLKEEGVSKNEPQEKLTIKKKDLEGKEGDIAVLVSSAA